MKQRTLTAEEVLQMREAMAAGKSVRQVAVERGLNYFTVYQVRRGWTYASAGGPVRHERERASVTPEVIERILALREQGYAIAQIARKAGLGLTSVKRALKEAECC